MAAYKIIVIDPEHPEYSSRFNPLLEAHNDIEIEQIAQTIIYAGNPGGQEPFWNNGAVRVLSLMLKCLRNQAQTSRPGVFTLSNAYRLLQNFGRLGQPLTSFCPTPRTIQSIRWIAACRMNGRESSSANQRHEAPVFLRRRPRPQFYL